jgi:sulfate transport system substrate-binding protein
VAKLFKNVPVLHSGPRLHQYLCAARLGDVLLAWENEAFLAINELTDKFEVVTPSRAFSPNRRSP